MELDISFGKHRADTNWKPEFLTWDEFVDRLRKVRRTNETMAEYNKMSNVARGKIKDGPAFVGGLVRGGRRKKENVDTRSLITLDVDHADDGFLFAAELVLGGSAYAISSTKTKGNPSVPSWSKSLKNLWQAHLCFWQATIFPEITLFEYWISSSRSSPITSPTYTLSQIRHNKRAFRLVD